VTRGPGPPPPLGPNPNGVDTSQAPYSFDTDEWKEIPKLQNERFRNEQTATDREQKDSAYPLVGNQTTWHKYTTLGYHCNDNRFQFETQWTRMLASKSDIAIGIPDILKRWAIDVAQPYLERNYPERLTPNTTDPRHARLQYNEPDLMGTDEDDQRKMPAIDWQVVGKPNTPRTPSTATQNATT
jgi:hypothetical protein